MGGLVSTPLKSGRRLLHDTTRSGVDGIGIRRYGTIVVKVWPIPACGSRVALWNVSSSPPCDPVTITTCPTSMIPRRDFAPLWNNRIDVYVVIPSRRRKHSSTIMVGWQITREYGSSFVGNFEKYRNVWHRLHYTQAEPIQQLNNINSLETKHKDIPVVKQFTSHIMHDSILNLLERNSIYR